MFRAWSPKLLRARCAASTMRCAVPKHARSAPYPCVCDVMCNTFYYFLRRGTFARAADKNVGELSAWCSMKSRDTHNVRTSWPPSASLPMSQPLLAVPRSTWVLWEEEEHCAVSFSHGCSQEFECLTCHCARWKGPNLAGDGGDVKLKRTPLWEAPLTSTRVNPLPVREQVPLKRATVQREDALLLAVERPHAGCRCSTEWQSQRPWSQRR